MINSRTVKWLTVRDGRTLKPVELADQDTKAWREAGLCPMQSQDLTGA